MASTRPPPVHRDPRRRLHGGRDPPGPGALRPRRRGSDGDQPHAPRRPRELAVLEGVAASRSRSIRQGNVEAAASATIVLIGVKPAMVPDLLREIAPHLRPGAIVVSLAAGVTIETFESILGTGVAVLRSMPNTPALVGKAVTGLAPGSRRDGRRSRCSSAGCSRPSAASSRCPSRRSTRSRPSRAPVLPMCSCSIEALTEAARRQGIHEAEARLMAEQTFIGAAALLEASGDGPGRTAASRDEPEGHDRARRSPCCRRRTWTACSPRRRMPRSRGRGSSRRAREPLPVEGREALDVGVRARHDDQVVVRHDRVASA